jgi:hypothetical protein
MSLNANMDTSVVSLKFVKKFAQFTQRTIATGLFSTALLAAEATLSPVWAVQQMSCTGQMNNGWSYTAEFLDGQFTQIRWERSGQPPQVSPLTFLATNIQGQPIYRGTLLAAVTVTLVDLSGGNVRTGSEISVGVEEWGWSRGSCGTSASTGGVGSSAPLEVVQQNLLGVDQVQAREWLRQNDFFFTSTIEHTDARVIERWNRDANRSIDVIILNGMVFDVVESR